MKIEKFFCLILLFLSVHEAKMYNRKKLIIHFGRKLTGDIQEILKQFNYYNEGDKQRQILFHYYMSSFLSIQKSFFINISQYSKGFWSKFAQMTHLTKPGSMVFHLRTFLKIINKQKIRNTKTLTLMISKYADNLKLSGMLSGSEKSYFVHSMLQILKRYQIVNKGANRFNFVMQRYQEEACEEVVQYLDSQSLFKVSKQVINHNKINLHKVLSKYIDYSYYKLPYQKMAKLYLKNNYKAQGIGMKKLDGVITKTRDYYIKKQASKMHVDYQEQSTGGLLSRFFRKSAGDMVLSKEKSVPIQRVIGDQLALSFSRIFNEQKFFSVQQVHKTYEKYTQFLNGLFVKIPPLKLKAINWYVKKNMLTLRKEKRNKIIKREKQMIIVKITPHLQAKSILKILINRHFKQTEKKEFVRGVNRMKQILLVQKAIHHTSKAMLYNTKRFAATQNKNLKRQIARIKETLIQIKKLTLQSKSIQKLNKNFFKIHDQKFHRIIQRLREIPLQKLHVPLVAKSIQKAVENKFLNMKQLKSLKKSVNRQKQLLLQDLFNKTLKSTYIGKNIDKKSLKNHQIKQYAKTLKRQKDYNIRSNKINLISKYVSQLRKYIRAQENVKSTKNLARIKELGMIVPKNHLKAISILKILNKNKSSVKQLRSYLRGINRQRENLIKAIGPIHYKATYFSNIKTGINMLFGLKKNQIQSIDREKNNDIKAIKVHLISKFAEQIKQQIKLSSNYKSAKNVSRIQELLIDINKKVMSSVAINKLSKQTRFSVAELRKTVKTLQRYKSKLIEKIGFKHHKARYDSRLYKNQQLFYRLQNHLQLARHKEIDYLSGLMRKIHKANAKLKDVKQINIKQKYSLNKDLSALKEFIIQKQFTPLSAKYFDNLLNKNSFTAQGLQQSIKDLTRYKSKLIEKIGFKHHKARYDSHHKKISEFKKRFQTHLNLQRLKELNYLDGLMRKVMKASAKLNIGKDNVLSKQQTQTLKKSLNAIKEFNLKKVQTHFQTKYIDNLLQKETLTKQDVIEATKSLARYKSKLIEKIGFKHHKARYDSHHKKVSLFRKQLQHRLNLQRLRELDYVSGLMRKVMKATAKINIADQNALSQQQIQTLKKDLSAIKEFGQLKIKQPLQLKYIDKLIQNEVLNRKDIIQAKKSLTRLKQKLIEKIGFKHNKIRLDFHYKKASELKKRFQNRLNLQRSKELMNINGLLRKVLKASAKLNLSENSVLGRKQTQILQKDLSSFKEFSLKKTKQPFQSKFIDNLLQKQTLNKQDMFEATKNLTRLKEKLIEKIGFQHQKVKYSDYIKVKTSLHEMLDNHLIMERQKQINLLSGLANKIQKASALIDLKQQFSSLQDQQLRKDLSAFKDFYIQKQRSPLKAKYIEELATQKQINQNQLKEVVKSINRIKENLINKVTPKKYAVTFDNRIIKKTSLEYKLQNHLDLVRLREATNLNSLIKKIQKAKAVLKQKGELSKIQNIQLRKDISAFKDYYISKVKDNQQANFISKFLEQTQIGSQELLEVNVNLQRQKDFLLQQISLTKQFISLEGKSLDSLALKAALHAKLQMNRFKEINITKHGMGRLDKVTFKLDDKIELSLAQDRDIKKALTAYRDFYVKKTKPQKSASFKQHMNMNLKLEFFSKKDFSYLNRMKDFRIANPKFTKNIMTMYASTFKNFYYNNYQDFKGVFNRFIDIWKNHKVIQKSETFYLKKNMPVRKFFYENFYHVGNLLKHYKHKLILDKNSKKALFDNKLIGITEQQMQKVINSINKLKLKMHNTNDLDSLISLKAVQTAMENFTSSEKLRTLKKFKYVFVEKIPDHRGLRFKGRLTQPSSKSERFVQNLFTSKIKYKQALHSENMMNFNIDTMPLTNSNIQIAKNVFKAALFYPQLNPFRDYLKHNKSQKPQINLGVKELQQAGKDILKKLQNKKASYWDKKELKFLSIIQKHSLSKKELKKIFSGNMLNKKISLKSQKFQKWTVLAFQTLVEIARFRKAEKMHKPIQINKLKLKRTETENENKLKHQNKKVKQIRSQNREIYNQIFRKVYNKKVRILPFQQKKIFKRYVKNFYYRLDRINNKSLKKTLLNFAAKQFQNKLKFYNILNSPFTSKDVKFNFNQVLKKFYSKHKSKNKQESFLKQVKEQFGTKALKKIQNLSRNISKQELKKTLNFLNQLIIGSIKESNQFRKDMTQSLNQFKKVIFTPNIGAPAKRQSFTDSEFEFYDSILKQKEIQKIRQQNDFGKRTISKQIPEEQEKEKPKKKPPVVVVCCMCGCFTSKQSCCDDEFDNKNLYFLQEAEDMININPKIQVNLFLQDENGKVKKEQSIDIQPLKDQPKSEQKEQPKETKNVLQSIVQSQKSQNTITDNLPQEVHEEQEKTQISQNTTTSETQEQTLKNQQPQKVFSIADKIIQQEENHENYISSAVQNASYQTNLLKSSDKQTLQPQNEVLEINEQELDNKYKQKISKYHQLHIDDLDNIYKIEHMKDYYKKYSQNYMKNNKKISTHFQDYNLDFQEGDSTQSESDIVKEFQQKSKNMNSQVIHVNNSSINSLQNNQNDLSDVYNSNLLDDISSFLKKQPATHNHIQENEYRLDNLEDSANDYYEILDNKKKLIQLQIFIIKQTNLKNGFQGLVSKLITNTK